MSPPTSFNKAKALEEASRLVSQKKISQAIKHYLAISERDPADLNLLNTIGDLCIRDGNTAEALKQFQNLADAYTHEGFLLKAVAILKKISKLVPQDVDPLLKLAEHYSSLGLGREAREHYLQAAALCEKQGLNHAALDIIRRLVKQEPENLAFRTRLAESCVALGQNGPAAAVYAEIAEIAYKRGELAAVDRPLERALQLDPANPQASLLSVKVALDSQQADRAKEILQSNSSIKTNPEAVCLLLDVHVLQGNFEAATQVVAGALRDGNDGAAILIHYVKACLNAGNPDAALKPIREIAAEAFERNQAAAICEPLRLISERYADHLPTLELSVQASERIPGGEALLQAANALSDAYSRADRKDLAENLYRQLLTREPGNNLWQARLNELLQTGSDGQEQTAAETPPPAPEQDQDEPDNPQVEEALENASIFARYGLIDKAFDELDRALKSEPENLKLLRQTFEVSKQDRPKRAIQAADAIAGLLRKRGDAEEAASFEELSRQVQASNAEEIPFPPPPSVEAGGAPLHPELPIPPADTHADLELPVDAMGASNRKVPAPPPAQAAPAIPASAVASGGIAVSQIDLTEEVEALASLQKGEIEEQAEEEAPTTAPDIFAEEKSEIEFYLEYGFFVEARQAIGALAEKFPTHPGLAALQQRIEETTQSIPAAEETAVEPEAELAPAVVEQAAGPEAESAPGEVGEAFEPKAESPPGEVDEAFEPKAKFTHAAEIEGVVAAPTPDQVTVADQADEPRPVPKAPVVEAPPFIITPVPGEPGGEAVPPFAQPPPAWLSGTFAETPPGPEEKPPAEESPRVLEVEPKSEETSSVEQVAPVAEPETASPEPTASEELSPTAEGVPGEPVPLVLEDVVPAPEVMPPGSETPVAEEPEMAGEVAPPIPPLIAVQETAATPEVIQTVPEPPAAEELATAPELTVEAVPESVPSLAPSVEEQQPVAEIAQAVPEAAVGPTPAPTELISEPAAEPVATVPLPAEELAPASEVAQAVPESPPVEQPATAPGLVSEPAIEPVAPVAPPVEEPLMTAELSQAVPEPPPVREQAAVSESVSAPATESVPTVPPQAIEPAPAAEITQAVPEHPPVPEPGEPPEPISEPATEPVATAPPPIAQTKVTPVEVVAEPEPPKPAEPEIEIEAGVPTQETLQVSEQAPESEPRATVEATTVEPVARPEPPSRPARAAEVPMKPQPKERLDLFPDLQALIIDSTQESPESGSQQAKPVPGEAKEPSRKPRRAAPHRPAASFNQILQELSGDLAIAESPDSPEKHYNLGLAFREMDLIDEAIGEFQKVVRGSVKGRLPPRFLEACSLLASCFMQKGMPSIAVKWYQRALDVPGLEGDALLALNYDLADAMDRAGQKKTALEKFMEVYSENIDYRDVADRIRALQHSPA